jgi:hypothetical protein
MSVSWFLPFLPQVFFAVRRSFYNFSIAHSRACSLPNFKSVMAQIAKILKSLLSILDNPCLVFYTYLVSDYIFSQKMHWQDREVFIYGT